MTNPTLIRTINLEYDLIEVHHNPLLKNKPFLIRVFNYDHSEPVELRLDQKEFDKLYIILKEHNLL